MSEKKKNVVDLPLFAEDIRRLLKDPKSLPPIDSWTPTREGEIDIVIAASGEWFYQGVKMERLAVVQLLSSILKREGDEYYLVSPAEKLKIRVEDVPFSVVMMDVEGEGKEQNIHFSTQTGDCFTLSEAHPFRLDQKKNGEASPYLLVRAGMEAKMNRSVYYEFVDLLQELDGSVPNYARVKVAGTIKDEELPEMGVWSSGKFFYIG